MQHKLLLLFVDKKVIVAKVKLCSKVVSDHDSASKPVALCALYHAYLEIASIYLRFFGINLQIFMQREYTGSDCLPIRSNGNPCVCLQAPEYIHRGGSKWHPSAFRICSLEQGYIAAGTQENRPEADPHTAGVPVAEQGSGHCGQK